jgi:hypothetical protein
LDRPSRVAERQALRVARHAPRSLVLLLAAHFTSSTCTTSRRCRSVRIPPSPRFHRNG